MNNIIIPYPNKENLKFYTENSIDGFILGIEKFSENFNYYVSENKLEKIISSLKSKNKKIYIMINKVIFDKDIVELIEILKKISTYDIEAVIYSDIAIFNIVKQYNLSINLIWHSKMVTNSKSINFYEKRGLYGFIATPQITIDEYIDITKNTECKSIVKLFGYTNMATSSRALITNYFKYINSDKKANKKYYLYESITDSYYPIIQTDNTNFFSSKILNGILEYRRLINENIDCDIYLDDYMIPENSFYNVIEAFIALKAHPNDDEFADKLKKVIDSNLFNETDDGFLNKRTIFKVKKDE